MKETISGLEEGPTVKLRLPEATRRFVRRAFADGIVEKIDESVKSNSCKMDKWERWKCLVVRYIADNQSTFDDLKKQVGLRTSKAVSKLYYQGLQTIWQASPEEVQEEFQKEEVFKAKRPPVYQRTPEIRAKTTASLNKPEVKTRLSGANKGKVFSEEHKTKIGAAQRGRNRSQEIKDKIAASQRERHRRREEKNEMIVFELRHTDKSKEGTSKQDTSGDTGRGLNK